MMSYAHAGQNQADQAQAGHAQAGHAQAGYAQAGHEATPKQATPRQATPNVLNLINSESRLDVQKVLTMTLKNSKSRLDAPNFATPRKVTLKQFVKVLNVMAKPLRKRGKE